MLSCIGKRTPSKRFQIVSAKVDEYYKKINLINSELKEITEHAAIIPSQRKRRIINDFKPIQDQMSCIIETINKLEDNYGLEKLEFNTSILRLIDLLF